MDLCKKHNCCASCTLDYLKSYLESKSRLPIPEFSGYHCMFWGAFFYLSGWSLKVRSTTRKLCNECRN